MSISRLKGKKAEDVACNFLIQNGLSLVTRNFSCRYGEIDLIMQDSDTLVFVEVRYRQSNKFGMAAETIDNNKQRKLVFTANYYLQKNPSPLATRFDVIAMSEKHPIEWISNAFMEY